MRCQIDRLLHSCIRKLQSIQRQTMFVAMKRHRQSLNAADQTRHLSFANFIRCSWIYVIILQRNERFCAVSRRIGAFSMRIANIKISYSLMIRTWTNSTDDEWMSFRWQAEGMRCVFALFKLAQLQFTNIIMNKIRNMYLHLPFSCPPIARSRSCRIFAHSLASAPPNGRHSFHSI